MNVDLDLLSVSDLARRIYFNDGAPCTGAREGPISVLFSTCMILAETSLTFSLDLINRLLRVSSRYSNDNKSNRSNLSRTSEAANSSL